MPDDKKLIIDEDWKSQVQAEKEAAAHEQPAAPPGPEAATQPGTGDAQMPAASFELLLTMLATEALVAMGQVAHPATGQAHVERNQAKYLIDTIEVLRTKTKGNLSGAEQQLIDSLLHQLRLAFVESANQPPAAGAAER